MSTLAGKVSVVTGATSGIGRGIAEHFAALGSNVVVHGRDRADGLETVRRVKAAGSDAEYFDGDLTSEEVCRSVIRFAVERFGGLDILVNNAGDTGRGDLEHIAVDRWDTILAVNLRAPFILTRGIARQMIEKGTKGSVINISSGAARKMRRTVVPYCTSKTALDRLTKGFAIELAEFGIRVNALEPGFAAGSSVSNLTDEHINNTIAAIPLGRPSAPSDVANGLLYLASDASSYVTGATLTIDGGNSIGSLAVHQAKKHPL